GWIPYMMDRMNEEFEKPFGKQAAIKRKPGDYIRSGQVWTTCEVEERALIQVLRQFNPRCVMWPSDYPQRTNAEHVQARYSEVLGQRRHQRSRKATDSLRESQAVLQFRNLNNARATEFPLENHFASHRSRTAQYLASQEGLLYEI
ncbi:MAG: hypothetical protein O7B35_07380, partial [Deltaproteobacteria bacterium]|nr:hypothetical protein [Deltaproteobacteria bacterium]